MTSLKIRTPEGVLFSFTLASPVTRCLAWVIDAMLIAVTSSALSKCIAIVGVLSSDLAHALQIIGFFAASIGYGILTEWYWRGQTVGKRLFHLRVMDDHGLRLRFNQIVLRNLLRAVDMLPGLYLIGGIASLVSPRAQRLGDLAASTIVVRTPRVAIPDLDQLMHGKYNSLRDYPHLEARLRQQISPAQAGVLLQAVLRREGFEPAARVALFSELAAFCKSLVRFPPEAVETLADEQYIRNVLEVIFRNSKAD